jgi:YfiH family protein
MLSFKLLSHHPFVHGVSTIKEGNIDARFSSEAKVAINLKKICGQLNIKKEAVVQMEQVHKTNVLLVDNQHRGKVIKEADGLVTKASGLVLMLRIADCIPIFLVDETKKAIGLVHCGWRGTVGKIILVAVEKMMHEFSSKPEDLRLILGPSIQSCCNYTQDSPIQVKLPEWKQFIHKENQKFYLDLQGFVIKTALQAGVKRQNIKNTNICTFHEDDYFSHKQSEIRNEKDERFLSLLGIINN